MLNATAAFRLEEARLRGSRPRVKAVLFPFDLDYGLGPGSGVFEHTVYGGEPGKLVLEEGFLEYAAWTSPVRQAFSPGVEGAAPFWEDQAAYMTLSISLRSGASEAEVEQSAYVRQSSGVEVELGPYFQVKVEFTDSVWAGEPPGYLAGLRLEGRLRVPESDILDPGEVRVELARDFSELRSGDHVLALDNRRGQWLPGSPNFCLLGLPWEQKQVALYHGWELAGGSVEWLLIYQGAVEGLGGMAHGWQGGHRAELESQEWIAWQLRKRIGAPTSDGERRPFMRGTYRTRAELVQVTPVEVSQPVKTGTGSASLKNLGEYRGKADQEYLLEAETTGEVGEALFRWSTNQGQSWREEGIVSAGAENPVELGEGLAVYWESGIGSDLTAGDRFTFTAQAPVYHYQLFGGPFADIAAVYLNDEETGAGVTADPETGAVLVTGRSVLVEARVVKDTTTHPVDIVADLLTEAGLGGAIHQDSFDLAKSVTPEYAVGVCFENATAAYAIREVLRRSLFDRWVDFGEIKLRAYLGED